MADSSSAEAAGRDRGQQPLTFEGRVALITGAGGGIGLAVALLFCELGARAVIVERDAERGRRAVERAGGEDVARLVTADVRDLEAMRSAVNTAIATWGRLDVACNNAGIGLTGPLVHEVDIEAFRQVVDVNLIAMVSMQAELGVMVPAGRGAIVNVS